MPNTYGIFYVTRTNDKTSDKGFRVGDEFKVPESSIKDPQSGGNARTFLVDRPDYAPLAPLAGCRIKYSYNEDYETLQGYPWESTQQWLDKLLTREYENGVKADGDDGHAVKYYAYGTYTPPRQEHAWPAVIEEDISSSYVSLGKYLSSKGKHYSGWGKPEADGLKYDISYAARVMLNLYRETLVPLWDEKKVIFRDLSWNNICVNNKAADPLFDTKLIDFGSAGHKGDDLTPNPLKPYGTRAFSAPEMDPYVKDPLAISEKKEPRSQPAADLWSFAALSAALLFGRDPSWRDDDPNAKDNGLDIFKMYDRLPESAKRTPGLAEYREAVFIGTKFEPEERRSDLVVWFLEAAMVMAEKAKGSVSEDDTVPPTDFAGDRMITKEIAADLTGLAAFLEDWRNHSSLSEPDDHDKYASMCADYLRLALTRDIAKAHYLFGVCLEEGYGTSEDPSRAARHYKAALEKGITSSALRLSRLYKQGSGVEQNRIAAAHYLGIALKDKECVSDARRDYIRDVVPKAIVSVLLILLGIAVGLASTSFLTAELLMDGELACDGLASFVVTTSRYAFFSVSMFASVTGFRLFGGLGNVHEGEHGYLKDLLSGAFDMLVAGFLVVPGTLVARAVVALAPFGLPLDTILPKVFFVLLLLLIIDEFNYVSSRLEDEIKRSALPVSKRELLLLSIPSAVLLVACSLAVWIVSWLLADGTATLSLAMIVEEANGSLGGLTASVFSNLCRCYSSVIILFWSISTSVPFAILQPFFFWL